MAKNISILDNEKDREIIIKNYPSLGNMYREYDEKLRKGNCSGCTKNNFRNRIVRHINSYNPVYEDFRYNLSENALKHIDKERKIKNKVKTESVDNYCEDCIRKHLCSVLILLTEYLEGYDHLEHARAELEQAEKEGLKANIKLSNTESALKKIKACLGIPGNNEYITGLLNVAEELVETEEDKNSIRLVRKKYM